MKKTIEAEVRKRVRTDLRCAFNNYQEHGTRFYDDHANEIAETLQVLMEMVDLAMSQAAVRMATARVIEAARRESVLHGKEETPCRICAAVKTFDKDKGKP